MQSDELKADIKCDDLIVGSGISGMSMALLMALSGRKVLIIEKQKNIGGSMRRFERGGIPFDTGFHFTGGFGGILSDMLGVLGIKDDIHPEFLDDPKSNRIYLENSDSMYEIPSGLDNISKQLKHYFPAESEAIDNYLGKEDDIERRTPLMDIGKLNSEELYLLMQQIDEDFITLQEYLDSITSDSKLQTILAGHALCYGSPPEVTPLSLHCRTSVGMHKSLARVKGGGNAFIKAFERRAKSLNIKIMINTEISDVSTPIGKNINSVQLSNGSLCCFENCILSIHPRNMLSILKNSLFPESTIKNIFNYEESFSFFSLFAVIQTDEPVVPSLTSYLTRDNLNSIISRTSADCAMAILTGNEIVSERKINTLCAFESEFPGEANRWKNLQCRSKDISYRNYKERRAASMIRKIEKVYPEYAGRIKIICTSSTLTFEDYIPPFGSAYGIMHKVGEQNIFGRLPIRNFYAIGQSSMTPGVVGAMLSSFIVARCLLGRNFIKEVL